MTRDTVNGTGATAWRRRLATLAGLAALALASACGSDSTDGAGGPAGGDAVDDAAFADEPTIKATFDITGDVTIKDTITAVLPANNDGSKPATCEEYAKGTTRSDGGAGLSLPNFVAADDIAGHSLTLDGRISDYKGPGTYPEPQLSGTANPIGFSIDSHSLVAEEGGDVSVTINADGSGSFTFAKLAETTPGVADPQSITGKLTWTCANA